MYRKLTLAISFAIAAFVAATPAAEAGLLRLRVENLTTGTGVVITDGGAGDSSPVAGVVSFSGAIDAGFIVNVTTGLTTLGGPYVAAGAYEAIDLASVNVNASGAGTLRIILEQADFGAATPDGLVILNSMVGGTLSAPAGSTVTFQSWGNDGNLIPTLGPDVSPSAALALVPDLPPAGSVGTTPQVFGPGAYGSSVSTAFFQTGTYSLFSVATISFAGAGSVSFDHETSTTPEPTSILAFAAVVPALAFLYRRRRISQIG